MKKINKIVDFIIQPILVLGLIAGIVVTIYSVNIFFIGFHNVDLAYNVCIISNDLDLDYRNMNDNYEIGKSISTTNLYITGNNQMQKSIFLGLIGAFAVGYFLVLLINYKGN